MPPPSYFKTLPARRHRPDRQNYCGPASLMTCIDALGWEPFTINQDDVFQTTHGEGSIDRSGSKSAPWASAPDLLTTALNNLAATTPPTRPGAKPVPYSLLSGRDPQVLNRAMAAGVEKFDAPSIALTEKGGHWITFVGYGANRAIKGSDDKTIRLGSVDAVNCGSVLPCPLGHQHADGDACEHEDGTPHITGVPVEAWDKAYFNTNLVGTRWAGKWVAICPTGALGEGAGDTTIHDLSTPARAGKTKAAPATGGAGEDQLVRPSGPPAIPVPLITPDEARVVVHTLLRQHGFHQREPWTTHLGGGDPEKIPKPGKPALVHHAHHPRHSYYLVPLRDSPVSVVVHAATGALVEIGLFRQPQAAPVWSEEEALERIAAAAPHRPLPRRAQRGDVHPVYLWAHSPLSQSRFRPLYGFQLGEEFWGVCPGGNARPLHASG